MPGDRARLLRRLHAPRDRGDARDARGYREGTDATGVGEAARAADGGGRGMTREGPGHETWADAAGAYLLDALTDDERKAYEAHFAECPACRDEVDELRMAADALPVSAPPL